MLNHPWSKPFNQADWLGIAIRRVSANQWHTGVVYVVNGTAKLRHLCGHLTLRDELAEDGRYLWIDVAALGSINKRLMALRLARAGQDKVPYGVGFLEDGRYLDKKTLLYCKTEPGMGLTCATYVMEIFHTFGYKPFVFSEWTADGADVKWQADALNDNLYNNPSDADHFEAEHQNIGSPRFHPQHVTGAGHPSKWPISRVDAEALAFQVTTDYSKWWPADLVH